MSSRAFRKGIGNKLSRAKYQSFVSQATHQFTLGKSTDDLKMAISILRTQADALESKLRAREENKE